MGYNYGYSPFTEWDDPPRDRGNTVEKYWTSCIFADFLYFWYLLIIKNGLPAWILPSMDGIIGSSHPHSAETLKHGVAMASIAIFLGSLDGIWWTFFIFFHTFGLFDVARSACAEVCLHGGDISPHCPPLWIRKNLRSYFLSMKQWRECLSPTLASTLINHQYFASSILEKIELSTFNLLPILPMRATNSSGKSISAILNRGKCGARKSLIVS